MKKILALAISAIALCGTVATAQTTEATDATSAADNNKMYQPQRFTDFAFEGVLLTVPQQARIDSLNAATRAANPRFNKRPGEATDTVAAPREKRHEAGRPGPRHDRRPMMGAPRPSREYVDKVKEILTPDQYTTFLENLLFNGTTMPAPGQDMHQATRDSKNLKSGVQKGDKKKNLKDGKRKDFKKKDVKKKDNKKSDTDK